MNRYKLFKEWYFNEEGRRISLNNSLNIPIGLLTILFAIIFYLITEYNYTISGIVLKIVFIIFLSMSILTCFISIFFLIKAYNNIFKGFEYNGLPYAQKLNGYYSELRKFYLIDHENEEKVNIDNKFEEYLTNELAEYIDNNVYNNDKKSEYLFKSKKCIIIGVLLIILTFIPYAINSYF